MKHRPKKIKRTSRDPKEQALKAELKEIAADELDPYEQKRRAERQEIADEFGCDVDDLGECMRCGSPWPSRMKYCPECNWDGFDMTGVN